MLKVCLIKISETYDLFRNVETNKFAMVGVEVNNLVEPPLLYITTDPSGSVSSGFIPVLYTFIKPVIGTGLKFYNASNPPVYPPVECEGCTEVFAEIESLYASEVESAHHHNVMVGTSAAFSVFGFVLCLLLLTLIFGIIIRYRIILWTAATPWKNRLVDFYHHLKSGSSLQAGNPMPDYTFDVLASDE
jgi:hypothetical protein